MRWAACNWGTFHCGWIQSSLCAAVTGPAVVNDARLAGDSESTSLTFSPFYSDCRGASRNDSKLPPHAAQNSTARSYLRWIRRKPAVWLLTATHRSPDPRSRRLGERIYMLLHGDVCLHVELGTHVNIRWSLPQGVESMKVIFVVVVAAAASRRFLGSSASPPDNKHNARALVLEDDGARQSRTSSRALALGSQTVSVCFSFFPNFNVRN